MKEKPLVLFVDDDKANRVVFEHSFSSQFKLKTVASGHEAMEVLRNEHVGVLVTDQRMPKMTGNELLARAKALYPSVIGIVVTAYSDLDPILRALNEGLVARYVIKPWKAEDLASIIAWGLEAHDLGVSSQALQLRLLESERLITLGAILAPVLHDMRQPLASLSMNGRRLEALYDGAHSPISKLASRHEGELTPREAKAIADLLEELGEIAADHVEACDLLTNMTARLFGIVSGEDPNTDETTSSKVPRVVDFVASVCAHAVRQVGATLERDLGDRDALPVVAIPAHMLARVLINLVSNAADALGGLDRDGRTIRISAAQQPEFLALVVADNGPGMSEEIRAKATQEFFSTKTKGAGLGLSQSRRLLEQAGGKLEIASEVGAGTTVRILLPLADCAKVIDG